MAEQPDIETMRIIAPDAGELERAAEAALRPKKLSEFVGQRVVRGQLQLVLDAARMRASTPDHVLLAGPPGLGKTTLAMIIAAEMGTSLRLTSGPAIQHAGDLAAILSGLQEGDILFIDEIHRLARTAEEMLYLAMEDFRVDVVVGKGPGATSIPLTLPPFTVVGATTRSGLLRCATVSASPRTWSSTRPKNSSRSSPAQPLSSARPSTLAPPMRSRHVRAARPASRTGFCAVSSTTRRCTVTEHSHWMPRAVPSNSSRSIPPAWTASTARSLRPCAVASPAAPWASRLCPSPSARKRKPLKPSLNRTWCARVSSCAPTADVWRPRRHGDTSA